MVEKPQTVGNYFKIPRFLPQEHDKLGQFSPVKSTFRIAESALVGSSSVRTTSACVFMTCIRKGMRANGREKVERLFWADGASAGKAYNRNRSVDACWPHGHSNVSQYILRDVVRGERRSRGTGLVFLRCLSESTCRHFSGI